MRHIILAFFGGRLEYDFLLVSVTRNLSSVSAKPRYARQTPSSHRYLQTNDIHNGLSPRRQVSLEAHFVRNAMPTNTSTATSAAILDTHLRHVADTQAEFQLGKHQHRRGLAPSLTSISVTRVAVGIQHKFLRYLQLCPIRKVPSGLLLSAPLNASLDETTFNLLGSCPDRLAGGGRERRGCREIYGRVL
jgi:hypothetical protein